MDLKNIKIEEIGIGSATLLCGEETIPILHYEEEKDYAKNFELVKSIVEHVIFYVLDYDNYHHDEINIDNKEYVKKPFVIAIIGVENIENRNLYPVENGYNVKLIDGKEKNKINDFSISKDDEILLQRKNKKL